MDEIIHIGFLLIPNVTQLDLTGPAQVLSRVPGAKIHLVWKAIEPVTVERLKTPAKIAWRALVLRKSTESEVSRPKSNAPSSNGCRSAD